MIVGRKIKVILNDLYYIKNGEYYITNNNYRELYDKSELELEIIGIVKAKEEADNRSYLYVSSELMDEIIKINSDSEIIKDGLKKDSNILGISADKDDTLAFLGYDALPSQINIYIANLFDKDKVIKKLDEYNQENDKLIYIDTMATAIDIVKKFIMIISIILIIFSIIAITISSLMIGILTNVRVLERKKEIGIFRSLGASKGDIRRLFNFQNMLIGCLALGISLFIIIVIKMPINNIIDNYLKIGDIFKINYGLLGLVFLINLIIIYIAGIIPTIKASRLAIVDCIYNR